MELARRTDGSASEVAAARLRDTTSIEAHVIDVVLFALFSEVSLPLSSIAVSSGRNDRCVTGSIAQIIAMQLVESFLRGGNIMIRVLLAHEVVVETGLTDAEHRVSLHNVIEFLGVGVSAANCSVGMVHFDGGAVGLLDLLGS